MGEAPEMAAVVRNDAKVVVLGSSGVGKTCIACRFVKNQFAPYIASTIGASFLVKQVAVNGQKVTLQIWDTAGQERFRSMAPLYYRGAMAAIFVFDITNELSFDKMKEWVRELQANVEEPLVLAIACNKVDLREQQAVAFEHAAKYAAEIGAIIVETSAKENIGVEHLFMEVSKRLVLTKFRNAKPAGTVTMAPQVLGTDGRRQKGCC
jgi:small GTP-binding protein